MKIHFQIRFIRFVLAFTMIFCFSMIRTDGTFAEVSPFTGVYGQAAERIYTLNIPCADHYRVENACMKDGYILLLTEALSDQSYMSETVMAHVSDSCEMILFPILNPEAAVHLSFDHFEGMYFLLADGMVLNTGWDGTYTLYDSDLSVIHRENTRQGIFLGASDNGDIWFFTDDSAFVLYRDGKLMLSVPSERMNTSNYIGTSGSKAYFTMYDANYDAYMLAIDLQDCTYQKDQMVSNSYSVANGFINYNTNDKWYVAGLNDPFMLTAFTKPNSSEHLLNMDENYLISETFDYDMTSGGFHQEFSVYEMANGGVCETKLSSELSEYRVNMLAYDQGLLLYETHDDDMETQGLFLWDINGMKAKAPARSYETCNYHIDQTRIDEMIRNIFDRYGVIVYYDQKHLNAYSRGYDLLECTNKALIGHVLCRLEELMAEYPDGLFEEMKSDSYREIVFCLCDRHVQTDEYTISDAAGTVISKDDTLRMSLDVHFWSTLRQIFLHENTHMMEYRMSDEISRITNRNYVSYWYLELNSPDCPPIQSYVWERTPENLKGVYDEDPDDAWYIDWYSKCTISEDEARTMEHGIYSSSAHYYTSPHIDRKSRFLLAMIREAFPCVKNSPEPVFWEQRTGAVDLRQEFPDFITR